MKSLSQLTRTNLEISKFCRVKTSNVNMMRRKEYRRAKKLNYFSREYTNESNPNPWFNSKKFKALVQHYQQIRNLHRGIQCLMKGTKPIPAETKIQLAEKFIQDAHWQYWNYRNFLKQHQQRQSLYASINLENQIATMPAKLREEVQALKQETEIPQMIDHQFHFSEQYQLCLPTSQRHRRNLLLRIQNPPKDRSLQEQEQE